MKLALASILALLFLGITLPSIGRLEENWKLVMTAWGAVAFFSVGLIATGRPGRRRLEILGWLMQFFLLLVVLN
jgi:hypothetical protein